MRVRVAAACLTAAAVAAAGVGCGGGGGDDARPRPATSAPASQITIDEPADGQALRGHEQEDGSLRLRARVRGGARPGSTVYLGASCVPEPCKAQAFVNANGRWSTTLDLATTADGRFVTIDANAQEGVVAAGSAVVTVELVSASDARSAIERDAERARAVPPAPASSNVPAKLPRDVLVIGDSLAIGMADELRKALPGWSVRTDSQISRPLAEGMQVLGRQPDTPAIVAFSLFTNDDPRDTSALESAVRTTATRPGGCAVWSTIAAPPVKGADYSEANQRLRMLATDPDLAEHLQVVDWSAAVARTPSLIAGDGVHATTAGYRKRARLFARAIKACAGRD